MNELSLHVCLSLFMTPNQGHTYVYGQMLQALLRSAQFNFMLRACLLAPFYTY